MKRDIKGAVMRLEIAKGLLFVGGGPSQGNAFEAGQRLFEEALALLTTQRGRLTRKERATLIKGATGEEPADAGCDREGGR